MVLIINVSNNLDGGGLQVALSFLKESANINGHNYHVFLGKNVAKQIDKKAFSSEFQFYDIPKLKFWQFHKILKPLEKQIKPDCVFTIFGPSYWKPNAPHLIGFAKGYYIYDEYIFFRQISNYNRIKISLMKCIHMSLFISQANHLVVETEDAEQRLRKILNTDIIDVVSNTYGAHYLCYPIIANKLPNRKKNEIRLITITKYYLHKNLESIPDVLEELERRNLCNITFTLTLDKKKYEKIIPLKWRKQVYNVGSIPIVECPSLYNECDLLYLPTLLETFSVSYPEAMIMQKPILTSNLSFAHSICRSSALYFDPLSAKDIADKIEFVINNRAIWLELIEEGKKRLQAFGTARSRAEKYLHLCEKLAFGTLK